MDILEIIKNNPLSIDNIDLSKYNKEEIKLILFELETQIDINKNFEQVKKRQLNALYGALANKFFPLYDIRLAKSITSLGRLYIKSIATKITEKLNIDLIYTHTDSLFFSCNKFFKDKIEFKKFGREVLNIADQQFRYLEESFNTKEKNYSKMDLEITYDKGMWVSGGRYILQDKRYPQKITGMEFIKSKSPFILKNLILNNLNVLDNKEKYIKIIQELYNDFQNKKVSDISFNIFVNNINKYIIDNNKKITIYQYISVLKAKHNQSYIIKELEHLESNLLGEINYEYVNSLLDLIKKNHGLEIDNIIQELLIFKHRSELSKFGENLSITLKPGTPIHIVSVLNTNTYLKDRNLLKEIIEDNSDVQYVYLKKNNPFNAKNIAFVKTEGELYEEICKYVDYDLQFEKGILNPLKEISNLHELNLNIDYFKNTKSTNTFSKFFI